MIMTLHVTVCSIVYIIYIQACNIIKTEHSKYHLDARGLLFLSGLFKSLRSTDSRS